MQVIAGRFIVSPSAMLINRHYCILQICPRNDDYTSNYRVDHIVDTISWNIIKTTAHVASVTVEYLKDSLGFSTNSWALSCGLKPQCYGLVVLTAVFSAHHAGRTGRKGGFEKLVNWYFLKKSKECLRARAWKLKKFWTNERLLFVVGIRSDFVAEKLN